MYIHKKTVNIMIMQKKNKYWLQVNYLKMYKICNLSFFFYVLNYVFFFWYFEYTIGSYNNKISKQFFVFQ